MEQVGKGAYGKALKAIDKRTRGTVVIKTIDITVLTDKQRQDTLTEINVLRKLRHPFIVRYYDNFMDRNNLCLTLEFADGGDLGARIRSTKARGEWFQENQICKWFTQILLGLSFIHSKNIMHRDLKPQNIFLMSRDDRVLIGDFGICRVLDSKNDLARTMIGTPYYLSPEVFQNRPYSFKSDIWALGCLLFEMAALTVPFNASGLASLSLQVCRGSTPQFPSRYSSALKHIFVKILQRDHRARPSADELLAYPLIAATVSKLSGGNSEPGRPPAGPSRLRSPSPSTANSARMRSPSPRVDKHSVRSASPRFIPTPPAAKSPRPSYRSMTPPRAPVYSPRIGSPRVVSARTPVKLTERSKSPAVRPPISPLKEIKNISNNLGISPRNVRIYPSSPLKQRMNS